MLTTQSFGLLISGLAISGFGIFTQQAALASAGAGVAGGIGSASLVASRRKDEERITTERNNAIQSDRFQALERAIGNLHHRIDLNNTDTQVSIDRLQNTCERDNAIQSDYLQALERAIDDLNRRLDLNSTAITDTQVSIERLESTSKTQGTHLNLLTKGHQQLQQLNHTHRGTIATQTTALSDKDCELAELKSELERIYSLVSSQPVSHPVAATEPVTHLLIDGNAMRFIEKEFGSIDYQILKDKLTQGADRVKCKFYIAETGKPAQKEFIAELKKIGFKIFFFPIVNQAGGIQKTKGDDVQIAIDAVNAVPGDRVILCGGGDSDFFPVVDRLKAKGIDFTIVAHKKTLGDRLRRSAGKNIIYFSAIDGIKLS